MVCGGGVKTGLPSVMVMVQGVWWMRSWWCPQSRTRSLERNIIAVAVSGHSATRSQLWRGSFSGMVRSLPAMRLFAVFPLPSARRSADVGLKIGRRLVGGRRRRRSPGGPRHRSYSGLDAHLVGRPAIPARVRSSEEIDTVPPPSGWHFALERTFFGEPHRFLRDQPPTAARRGTSSGQAGHA